MNKVRIVQDQYPQDPRKDDNICLMVCRHGRYQLGDSKAKEVLAKALDVYASDYDEIELVQKAEKAGLIFTQRPLYLYDHGNITMSTTPFSCPFDSGQVGVILVLKETIRHEFNVKRFGKKVTQRMMEMAHRHIDSEVSSYDSYISGDIYMLQFLNSKGEVEDSIGGFYGDNVELNGMLEHVSDDLKQAVRECDVTFI